MYILEKNQLDSAYRYADDIKSGKINACKWIKLAVDRFYNYIEHGHHKGIYFDEDKASLALQSFDFYNIKKTITVKDRNGRLSQKNVYSPFVLEPWQAFIEANLFGFYKENYRMFTQAVICVPRKNGKTTWAAANGLTGLVFDGEIESQVYCAATKKDQARILFKEAKKIINISPELKKLFDKDDLTKDAISFPRTESYFQPVSSDYNTLDGLNPHFVVLDETHEYKDSGLYDIFISGMGNRLNPLAFIITTAGFHKDYWFYQFLESCLGVLQGRFEDDSIFVAYYTLDSEDEINDPKCWIKANPNLGVSVQEKFLALEVEQSKNIPTKKVSVLTKNFNIFTESSNIWIENHYLDQNLITWEEVCRIGWKNVYYGFDLASSKDFFAITKFFTLNDGRFFIKHKIYAPAETIGNRYSGTLGMNINLWIQNGYISTTPGRVIDKAFVKQDFLNDVVEYGFTFGGYDPYKATEFIDELNNELGKEYIYNEERNKMEEVYKLQPVPQRITHLCTATEKFQELIYEGRMLHDGNPVFMWMLANVDIRTDPVGNVMPNRSNTNKKIDAVMSTVDAIDIWMRYEDNDNSTLEDYICVR